jgi:membrane protease YdiL (CAAX protease family)
VPTYRELFLELLAWLIVASICAAIGIPLWLRKRRQAERLLAQVPLNPVTWTGWEILAAFLLTYLFWPSLVGLWMDHSGYFSWLYGLSSDQIPNDVAKQEHSFWIQLFTVPFKLATVLIIFRLASGTQAYQLGLSFHSSLESQALACLSWLMVTPAVFGVNFLVSIGFFYLTGQKPEHPLEQLAEASPLLIDLILIGLVALAAAPIWEEFFFRGVIQPWLAQNDWRSHFVMGLNLLIGISTGIANFKEHQAANFGMILGNLSPILFVMILLPSYIYADRLVKRWIPDRNGCRAIFATSLLFAMLHSKVWPTPIPLFFLALALGLLAYRSQSLLASIIFHSLFNAVAWIALLFLQFGPEPTNGSEATSAGTQPVSTATSTLVPTP